MNMQRTRKSSSISSQKADTGAGQTSDNNQSSSSEEGSINFKEGDHYWVLYTNKKFPLAFNQFFAAKLARFRGSNLKFEWLDDSGEKGTQRTVAQVKTQGVHPITEQHLQILKSNNLGWSLQDVQDLQSQQQQQDPVFDGSPINIQFTGFYQPNNTTFWNERLQWLRNSFNPEDLIIRRIKLP